LVFLVRDGAANAPVFPCLFMGTADPRSKKPIARESRKLWAMWDVYLYRNFRESFFCMMNLWCGPG
jgi:hypothetical protein